MLLMLRLSPHNIETFLKKYDTQLMMAIIKYIPILVAEEVDDLPEFVNRTLNTAKINGCFRRTFGHKSDSKEIDASDINAYAINIITTASEVSLRASIYEPHMEITADGNFKPFKVEVPQVMVLWKLDNNVLTCSLKFVNGNIEQLKSWKI